MINILFKKQNISLGKRKRAIARIFLNSGEGNLIINSINGNKYLQYNKTYLKLIWLPIQLLKLEKQINIVAFVKGGGFSSQVQSIQLGISRQLCKFNNINRSILKSLSLLTRDSRIKERKKYGLKKARKASQYSKR